MTEPYQPPPEATSSTGTGLLPPRTTPDPRSVTGAWYLARGKYGGRKAKSEPGKPYQPGDKPVLWVVAYHVGGKVLGVILTLAGFWLAKVLGLQEEVRAVLKLIVGGQ